MADAKTSPYAYTGNPGYTFILDGGPVTLEVGQIVELTDEQAAQLGDEFTTTKTTKPAPADKPEKD